MAGEKAAEGILPADGRLSREGLAEGRVSTIASGNGAAVPGV